MATKPPTSLIYVLMIISLYIFVQYFLGGNHDDFFDGNRGKVVFFFFITFFLNPPLAPVRGHDSSTPGACPRQVVLSMQMLRSRFLKSCPQEPCRFRSGLSNFLSPHLRQQQLPNSVGGIAPPQLTHLFNHYTNGCADGLGGWGLLEQY